MLLANQALVKQVKDLEDEKKKLKQEILTRDKTISQANRDIKTLREDQESLIAVIEKQKLQLEDW
jgi:predicted  nucleic acid-binding Zn-ribbon protein